MEGMWTSVARGYHVFNYEWADPRTRDLPLLGNPFLLVAIGLGYVFCATRLGPWLMRDRKGLELRGVMIAYNVAQIVCNCWLLKELLVGYWLNDYSLRCQPIDWSLSPKAVWMTRLCYMYFLLKIVDFCDTLLFVLRKKENQITTLHVSHHFGILITCYIGTKYYPGGHTSFLVPMNTFVHSVMYCYYLVSVLKISRIWWKKYITQIQLAQHTIVGLHTIQLLFSNPCNYPLFPVIGLIPPAVYLIVQFSWFYSQAYLKRPGRGSRSSSECSPKDSEKAGKMH